MFEKIPTVLTADELTTKAFKRAGKISTYDKEKERRVKFTQIDRIKASQHIIADTLGKYILTFPSFDVDQSKIMKKKTSRSRSQFIVDRHERVNAFYYHLVDLEIGVDDMKRSLGALAWCVKTVNKLATDHIRELKRTETISDMYVIKRRATARMASVIKQISKDLLFLNTARDVLRAMPVFYPEAHTVVVAGCPNVGKSSLIRLISTAQPMVASYPFTTKGISMGYFERKRIKYQIIDTPGLLDRPLEKRNNIEKQAILAIAHLADVIVFILDPSESCGYAMEQQLGLLEHIKKDFSDTPLLEAENKTDLLATDAGRVKITTLDDDASRSSIEVLLDGVADVFSALDQPERQTTRP